MDMSLPSQPDRHREKRTPKNSSPKSQSLKFRDLQEVLRAGINTIRELWSYDAKEWVTSVHAEDIDDDGSIEILLASRAGHVLALDAQGVLKWEVPLGKERVINSVIGMPFVEGMRLGVRVIVGSRDGVVYALNQNGHVVWTYATDRPVRQVYINSQQLDVVIVGSEDCCVHVLDSATGELRGEKFRTNGLIRSVFSFDIDRDGQIEVLASSADKYVYVLDSQAQLKSKFTTEYEVYTLSAITLEQNDQIQLVTSSNNDEVCAWNVIPQNQSALLFQKTWSTSFNGKNLLKRVHSIYVADVNNDRKTELILGSEGRHISFFDQGGALLWQHSFDHQVTSVYARDVNGDGYIELIVGLADHSVHVLGVELIENLYHSIIQAYKEIQHSLAIHAKLSAEEYELLATVTGEQQESNHLAHTLEFAVYQMLQGKYDQALPALLKIQQDGVQRCWSGPITGVGHIRTLCLGDVAEDPKDAILLGNEEGFVIAIDIKNEKKTVLWRTRSQNGILDLYMGTPVRSHNDSVVALQEDHRICMLSSSGKIQKLVIPGSDNPLCVFVENGFFQKIIVGEENKKISIYDDHLERKLLVIQTPQNVTIVRGYNETKNDKLAIVAGTGEGEIYAYSGEGAEIWRYQARGDICALEIKDIDNDGQPEVIVGSEGRNIYVLDYQGHLKWRYLTPYYVRTIDVCAVDGEGTCKILLGSRDGFIHVLTGDGTPIWTYKADISVRVLRAKDMNDDGHVEIAFGSDDQLDLLQIVDQKRLRACIGTCWDNLLATLSPDGDLRRAIIRLTKDRDEYVRSHALKMLATLQGHLEEDFSIFEEAIHDGSREVRKAVADACVSLYARNVQENGNVRRLQKIMQQLVVAPEQEVCFAMIRALSALVGYKDARAFEYLGSLAVCNDVWVRRATIRELSSLARMYPEQAFRLFLTTINDQEEWIGEETERGLAHFFDIHTSKLLLCAHELLTWGIDPTILQNISSFIQQLVVKKTLDVLSYFLGGLAEERVPVVLDRLIDVFKEIRKQGLSDGEEYLEIYEELRDLLKITKFSDVVQYHYHVDDTLTANVPSLTRIVHICERLENVASEFRTYQRRQASEDRTSSLLNARDLLDEIREDLEAERIYRSHRNADSVQLPEDLILGFVQQHWSDIIVRELQRLRRRAGAELHFELSVQTAPVGEQLTISLLISNTGRSPADNIRITLETSDQFTISGSNQRRLAEVAGLSPFPVEFVVYPQADPMRIEFTIIYDDAERRGKKEWFGDRLSLQEQSFTEIPNLYGAKTPVRTKEMFYGRERELFFLQEKLSNTSSNTVVVLTGQSRAGKTSLLYQLINERHLLSPHCAVLIDMQTLALNSDASQLLAGIAAVIYEALRAGGIDGSPPDGLSFERDATFAFDQFIKRVLRTLSGHKLILLFDEFGVLERKIKEEQLDPNFLRYLLGLMQHHEGITFLLAGTPLVRHLTEGYWPTFSDLAFHLSLSKLEPADARRLIEEPVEGSLQYDEFAIEKISQLTGDQPYLIHIICDILIRNRNKNRKNYVNTNDVNFAAERILESEESQFARINQRVKSSGARFILSVLVQEQSEDGQEVSLSDIKEAYARQDMQFDQKKVLRYIHQLVQEELVEQDENDTRFRIPVGLIRRWLRKVWLPAYLQELSDEDTWFGDASSSSSQLVPFQKEEIASKYIATVSEGNVSVDAQRFLPREETTEDFDVFLCHNNADKPFVKQIGVQLKEQGILPWLDEWELRPGLPWQQTLEQQIERIKTVAIFVGKDGVGPWQHQELDAFLREFVRRGCPVIPILLPDAPQEPKLPVFLRAFAWIDFRVKNPDPMQRLIWGITGERDSMR